MKVLQTKRLNVLTGASSDKKKGRGVWAEASVQRERGSTINGLAQMNRLGLLTDTPLFYFFSSSPLLALFLFSLLFFFQGMSAIKAGRIDFLILPLPPLLLFNTPLPLPTPCSPNQYRICMYTGIKYKRTVEQCHSGGAIL